MASPRASIVYEAAIDEDEMKAMAKTKVLIRGAI
jgi:hypothetical protein